MRFVGEPPSPNTRVRHGRPKVRVSLSRGIHHRLPDDAGDRSRQELKPVDPPSSDSSLIRRQDWEAAGTRARLSRARRAPATGRSASTPGRANHSGTPVGPMDRESHRSGATRDSWAGRSSGIRGAGRSTRAAPGRTGRTGSRSTARRCRPTARSRGSLATTRLVHQWRDVPSLGIGYGWVGVYAASPRPRPLTVSVVAGDRRARPRRGVPEWAELRDTGRTGPARAADRAGQVRLGYACRWNGRIAHPVGEGAAADGGDLRGRREDRANRPRPHFRVAAAGAGQAVSSTS